MDALSRLGARAIGTAPASVRPMIAPLFLTRPPEMSRDDADLFVVAPTPQHRVRQRLERDPGVAEPGASALTDDERGREGPRWPGRHTPVDVRPVDRGVEPPIPEAVRTAQPDTPRSERRSTWRADAPTRVPVDGPPEAVASTGRRPGSRASVVPGPAPVAQAAVVTEGVASEGEPRPAFGRTTTDREPEGWSSARFLGRLRAIRESVAAPERSRDDERPPTVRVTIGRIDVRSTPPVAPEPPRVPARAPASRLTLAEYLTRKGRGAS
jgi:hypothetical protein